MIKKIRILLSSVFAAVICASLLPAIALADEPSVTVSFDKTGDETVEVYVENTGGISESVSALQLSIGIAVESGSLDGIDVSFAFSNAFSATIKEAMPFNRGSGMLNVYIAGGSDLLASKLDLGTLSFSANQNAEATLDVTVAGLEEGDGAGGLQVVGAARNAMDGYAVQSNNAQMVFKPQPITSNPEEKPGTDPSTPNPDDKNNVSPIVPKPVNSTTDTPQTGDASVFAIINLCVVAALAACVAVFTSKRDKKESGR